MTRDHKSQNRPPVSARTAADSNPTTDAQWEQIVLELRDCGNRPSDGLDDLAIARYLSGECSASERERIQKAIGQSPNLANCIVLAQQSLGGVEAAL